MTNLQKSWLENVAVDVVADIDLDRGGLNVVVVVIAYAQDIAWGLKRAKLFFVVIALTFIAMAFQKLGD